MTQTNVLLLICHDLGQHLGCYGVESVHSPAVDGLAAEGVRFANYFCTAPQCSPSRAAIMTGRYPHANGVMGLSHQPFSWVLPETERHVAAIMRDAGRRTVLSGIQHVTQKPRSLGFDEVLKTPSRTAVDVSDAFIDWLDHYDPAGGPFHAQVGFFEPHRHFGYGGVEPDDSGGVFVPRYLPDVEAARSELALFQGAIRRMDENVARILAKLDERGLADDTLVIFTADHGIPFPRAKCTLYDPGLTTPLVLRWPKGTLTGGRVHDQMLSNVDLLPTVLDLLGIDGPDNLQGRSFAPLLTGDSYAPREAVFAEKTFHTHYDPLRCVRTDRWKLIANFEHGHIVEVPTDIFGGATYHAMVPSLAKGRPDFELYDLSEDPDETENLAGRDEFADVEKTLRRQLFHHLETTGDPLLNGPPPSPTWKRVKETLREA